MTSLFSLKHQCIRRRDVSGTDHRWRSGTETIRSRWMTDPSGGTLQARQRQPPQTSIRRYSRRPGALWRAARLLSFLRFGVTNKLRSLVAVTPLRPGSATSLDHTRQLQRARLLSRDNPSRLKISESTRRSCRTGCAAALITDAARRIC